MIHADRRVIGGARGVMEQRVGRMRTRHVESSRSRRLDRRRDDVDLLATQAAFLAGMRVEPAHGEPRPRDAEIAAKIVAR